MSRELNSKKWFWFAILFQNVFAYVIALCVYQYGIWITQGVFGAGTVVALAFTAIILYGLFRKDPYKGKTFESVK
jgi:ferrous iron transport protein B